ncbi:MAG: hypothetical protein JWM64_2755 [Frankiales bacterium]|nr:hypothetical protein [Frankiales bacterium]
MQSELMQITPWRSIAAGVVPVPPQRLSFAQGLESPCTSCSTSPCCTYLPLDTFTVSSLADLSRADHLLGFDRIRLGLNRAGEWSVYYVQPCRFLDRDTFLCGIRGTDRHPHTCQTYDPHSCWYRRSLTSSVTGDFVQVDRPRFALLAGLLELDERRAVVASPDWDEIVSRLAAEPDVDVPPPPEPELADPAFDRWRQVALGTAPPEARLLPLSVADAAEPCDGCAAPCCSTLLFPQGLPASRGALDFFRFCLGFPGIELLVTDDAWSLVVKATCRHLQDGRCGIFGKPERPLSCVSYDSYRCTYKSAFGRAQPAASVRVRLEQLDALAECVLVDEDGQVVAVAPVAAVRERVEQRWREGAAP